MFPINATRGAGNATDAVELKLVGFTAGTARTQGSLEENRAARIDAAEVEESEFASR